MSHWLGDAGICCSLMYSPASASLRHLGTPCLLFTSLMPHRCPLSHHRPSCSGKAGLSVPGTPRPFPPCPSVFAVASACLSSSSLSLSHAWSILIVQGSPPWEQVTVPHTYTSQGLRVTLLSSSETLEFIFLLSCLACAPEGQASSCLRHPQVLSTLSLNE